MLEVIGISNTRDSVSSGYPSTEKTVENAKRNVVFGYKEDETLSQVFDISSQSKQKLRTKQRNKIVKLLAN